MISLVEVRENPVNSSPSQLHALRLDTPISITIKIIVQRTSGQFVYASMVVKHVDSAQHKPVERLEAVLRIVNSLNDIPLAELD